MPKYDSIDNIPAKVFFEILESRNYQSLRPKPKEKGLEQVFMSIYDEWFKRAENTSAKEYLANNNKIIYHEIKIATIKTILKFIWDLPEHAIGFKAVADIVVSLVDAMEKDLEIFVDRDNILLDEIQRILQVEIGILENEIMFAKAEIDMMQKQASGKIFDFYDSLVSISSVYPYGRTLDERMTLAMYVAEEKAAIQISRKRNTKQAA